MWFYDDSEDELTRINEAISADSEFWQLQPGANAVHVTFGDTTTGNQIAVPLGIDEVMVAVEQWPAHAESAGVPKVFSEEINRNLRLRLDE